jgi:rRNA maturation endonuclease Nob1
VEVLYVLRRITRAGALAYKGQCSRCGGWFEDWSGGVCDACTAAGR